MGVCVGLGDNTVFGRIAKQAARDRPGMTTLEIEILRFVIIIAAMAFSVAIFLCSQSSPRLFTHLVLSYNQSFGEPGFVGTIPALLTFRHCWSIVSLSWLHLSLVGFR